MYSGRWETFATLCSKFIQDTMYQLLSESAEFCRRYDKNILAYFFLGHGYIDSTTAIDRTERRQIVEHALDTSRH